MAEEKINVENNCTTAHCDGIDEWFDPVFRCDNCDGTFMLGGLHSGKFCPHCGKKIIFGPLSSGNKDMP